MEALSTGSTLRIGEWAAAPATNELTRGTETVRIEPKAMDVLMVLARRPGAVVSREELFAAVWPGTVVGDEALSQSITKLRRALGDDPRAPTYIETISKRGYRLLAPVRPDADGATQSRRPVDAPRRRLLRAMLVAGLVIALSAGGLFLYQSPPRRAPPAAPGETGRPGSWVAVVVVPFDSLGPAGKEDYLAHGISANLASALGRLSSLRVIRSSGVPGARPATGARYVVSGDVQRRGDMLRVNVNLIDARDNRQLSSERFDRPFGDLFEVQDDIIRRVTESLQAKVSDAERRRLAERYTRSVDAYEQFLRAQERFLARGPRENQEARDLYRKAIELDPKFARAYAGLAMSYAMEYRLEPAPGARASLERAFELAESARQIDPDIPEVHWAIGFVHAQGRRHDLAIASLERAIELNPSFADAYALMAGIRTYVGEPAKAVPLLRTAMRLNPDGGYLYYLILGRAFLLLDDFDQAQINLREALVRNPADVEARALLAATLVAAGNPAAAAWEAEEIRSIDRAFTARRWLEIYPLASDAHRDKLQRLLAAAGL